MLFKHLLYSNIIPLAPGFIDQETETPREQKICLMDPVKLQNHDLVTSLSNNRASRSPLQCTVNKAKPLWLIILS